jgi:hypothetical protein
MLRDLAGKWKDAAWMRALKVTTQQQIFDDGWYGVTRLQKTRAVSGHSCTRCNEPVFPRHGNCLKRTYVLDSATEICGACLKRWPVAEADQHRTYICSKRHPQKTATKPAAPLVDRPARQTSAGKAKPKTLGGAKRFQQLFAEHFRDLDGKYGQPVVRASLWRWFTEKFAPAHAEESYETLLRTCQLHPDKSVDLPLDRDDVEEVFKYFRPIVEAEVKRERAARNA